MAFIKKHFEKILLAGILLILTGVAGFLAWEVEKLSEVVNAGVQGSTVERILNLSSTAVYSNAIHGLKTPVTWQTNAMDPFHTGIEIVRLQSGFTNPPAIHGPAMPKQPFTLVKISRKPFRLIFKSYNGTGENFGLNEGRRTIYVPKVGDKIWSPVDKYDTGFIITKFEKKEAMVPVPGIGKQLRDTSELTIQHGSNEPPVILVLNRITEEHEPEATIICLADNQELSVHKGQTVACGGKIYNILDINLQQVLISDERTKERFTVDKQ